MPTRFQRLTQAIRTRAGHAFETAITALTPLPPPNPEPSPTRKVEPGDKLQKGEYTDIPVAVWGDWTLPKIRVAVNAFVVGNFGQAALLVESMLGDDRIQGAVQGRLKAVTKCDSIFTPADDDTNGAISDELEELWPDILPIETLEAILTWSTFLFFCLIEKVWEVRTVDGEQRFVPRLKVWHPLYVYYDLSVRRYVAITQEGMVYITPGDPKWILFTPGGEYRGWMRGAVRSCSVPWIVRQFALRDWARFSEKHGLPLLIAKVPAQSSAEDKARFFGSLKNLGSETGIQVPVQGGQDAADFGVDMIEAKDTSWKAFPGLRDACDESITLAIRGTNLTTNVEGGSHAAANAHRDEDADLSIADRNKLAACLQRQLIDQYVALNYGDSSLAPKLSYVSPESDADSDADVLVKVSQAMTSLKAISLPFDVQDMADRFGIKLDDSQDLTAFNAAPEPEPALDVPDPGPPDSRDQPRSDRQPDARARRNRPAKRLPRRKSAA